MKALFISIQIVVEPQFMTFGTNIYSTNLILNLVKCLFSLKQNRRSNERRFPTLIELVILIWNSTKHPKNMLNKPCAKSSFFWQKRKVISSDLPGGNRQVHVEHQARHMQRHGSREQNQHANLGHALTRHSH
jgi:hypothetical protein